MNNRIITIVVLAIIVILGGVWYLQKDEVATPVAREPIKIGVITDLTGPAAYWGESTRVGAELAVQELAEDGFEVELVFEDYQLDAAKGASAAQKLVNVDNVDALYVEFNPGAIAAASVVKSAPRLMIYDAAITSPLSESPYFYKTYLDYEAGCEAVAREFKQAGVEKIGLLEINIEAGQLCEKGVGKVFTGENLALETYNLGDTDFRTQILKLQDAGATAVVNVGFEGDTYNALKVIKDMNYDLRYGTVADSVTEKVQTEFGGELKDGFAFGFADPSESFVSKLGVELDTYYGAALAYTHIKQLARVAAECGRDEVCISREMDSLDGDRAIGFNGFADKMAQLEMSMIKY